MGRPAGGPGGDAARQRREWRALMNVRPEDERAGHATARPGGAPDGTALETAYDISLDVDGLDLMPS